jgi:hypothetical protein
LGEDVAHAVCVGARVAERPVLRVAPVVCDVVRKALDVGARRSREERDDESYEQREGRAHC